MQLANRSFRSVKLKDRVAIVTGAASGIGRASAIAFAREGARVVVADTERERRQETTVTSILAEGNEAFFARVDVTREAEIVQMIADTAEPLGSDRHSLQQCRSGARKADRADVGRGVGSGHGDQRQGCVPGD